MDIKGRLRPQFLTLLLIPLGFWAYRYALRAPFVYDDRGYILQNPSITSLSGFLDISGTRYMGFLSFALNYAAGGLTPFDFHLVNVVIHIINSLLVFSLVSSTFDTPLFDQPCKNAPQRHYFAFSAALIFLLHPLQTQAVSYVTQRFTSLATLFYILAVCLYARARLAMDGAGQGGRAGRAAPWLLYAAAFASAVLAMKTKEISFTLPFAVALYDLIFFAPRGVKKGSWLRAPFYLTLLIIPLSLMAPDIGVDGGSPVNEALRRLQLKEAATLDRGVYTLTQFSVIVTYIRLFFFPAGQRIDYDYKLSDTIFEFRTLASFAVLAALFAAALFVLYRSIKHKNANGALFSFGVFWFFISLSVESFMVPIQDVIFEHRAYLPGFGLTLAFVSSLFYLIERLGGAGARRCSAAGFLFMVLFISPALFYLTNERNKIWCDELRLVNEAIGHKTGKARLYYVRAMVYIDRNDFENALKDAQKAVSMKPLSPDMNNLRGIANAGLGRFRESIEDFTRVIELDPAYHMAYYNRARSYAGMNKIKEAIADYSAEIKLRPDLADAYNGRGIAYYRLGENGRAVVDIRAACSRGLADACANLKEIAVTPL